MKRATTLLALLLGSALCPKSAEALQMILSTRDPQCLYVEPKRVGAELEVHYTISGVNESEVIFTVSTNKQTPGFFLERLC